MLLGGAGQLEEEWPAAKAALQRLQTTHTWEHHLGAMLGAKVSMLPDCWLHRCEMSRQRSADVRPLDFGTCAPWCTFGVAQ